VDDEKRFQMALNYLAQAFRGMGMDHAAEGAQRALLETREPVEYRGDGVGTPTASPGGGSGGGGPRVVGQKAAPTVSADRARF